MTGVLTPGGFTVEVETDPEPGPRPEGTRLVIDGYPRSANTFAAACFERLFPGVPCDHHQHHPDAVLRGIKAGCPAIVLLRDPLHACASFALLHEPGHDLGELVRRWLRYYQGVFPRLGRFVLLDFYAAISPRLLDAFATVGFVPPPVDWSSLRADVLASIRGNGGNPDDLATIYGVAAPDPRRPLAEMRERIEQVPELGAARELYAELQGRCFGV